MSDSIQVESGKDGHETYRNIVAAGLSFLAPQMFTPSGDTFPDWLIPKGAEGTEYVIAGPISFEDGVPGPLTFVYSDGGMAALEDPLDMLNVALMLSDAKQSGVINSDAYIPVGVV